MSDSIENELNQENDVFLGKRMTAPDASGLAEKIVLASRNLPQDLNKPVSKAAWNNLFAWSFLANLSKPRSIVVTSALACLMLAVISGLWYMPHTGTINTPTIAHSTSVDVDTLSEEFSWDSLLIMQDELAFAGL